MTEKELEKIYSEAYRAVYWTAMSLLKNEEDAEDVVQDTFVSFIKSYSDLTDTSKSTALLKRIAANKCLDRIKLSKTVNMEDEFFDNVEAVPEDFLPDTIIESADMRKIVMDIINDSLSEDVRRTLILFYFNELSTKEIAEALGVPQGTVLRRLNFARNKIKKEVEKYEEENDTKLFAMAIPFLSKLFIKESEQVPMKPMPAKIADLSASAKASPEASGNDAAMKASKEALKKGTEIMSKKVIFGGLAGLVAVGLTVGIIATVVNKKPEKVKTKKTRIEAADGSEKKSDKSDRSDKDLSVFSDTGENENNETEATAAPAVLTDDSIVIHMNGMSAEEIADNLFKTADVSVGMSKEEYQDRFYVPEDKTLAGKKYNTQDDSWYWTFYGSLSDDARIFILYVQAPKDEDGRLTATDQGTGVAVTATFKDDAFSEEVFDKCIEKYESFGYTVSYDSATLVDGGRLVEFEADGIKTRITFNPGQIVLNIPFSIFAK